MRIPTFWLVLLLVAAPAANAQSSSRRDLGPEIGTRDGKRPHPHRTYDEYYAHHRDRDDALAEISTLSHWSVEAWRKDVLDYAYRKGRGATGRTWSASGRKPTVEPLEDTSEPTETALQSGATEVWEGSKKVGRALGTKLGEGWRAGKRGAKRLGRKVAEGAEDVGEKVWTAGEQLMESGSEYVDNDDDDD